jgi:hypothetical protein
MATKGFQELREKVTGGDQPTAQATEKKADQSIGSVLKEGAEFGFSFGYSKFLEGFAFGTLQGIDYAKTQLKNQLENREQIKVQIDVNALCDNLPVFDSPEIKVIGGER